MTDYSIKFGKAVIRTEMESGPARQRRRYTQVPSMINVRFDFTLEQFGIFEKFWEQDLLHGERWFEIKLVNGVGEKTYTARFDANEPPEAVSVAKGRGWVVKARLEVEARQLPT
ncbi:hypothetical protein [Methylocaldum szegediense]|uniref:hypothetical protein n=1 Tax=Methylocaldum szegediense TaxID=73780 RepID=UPI000402AF86|nr:hypothetical protein [Methylocaldum szegediense]